MVNNPAMAQLLRRCILVAAAGVKRRHDACFEGYPWRLFQLADGRIPVARAREICIAFLSSRFCDLPPGFARRWAERLWRDHASDAVRVEEMLKCHGAFLAAVWAMKLSVAPVERLHAWSRAQTKNNMRFHSLAAKFINQERQTLVRAALTEKRRDCVQSQGVRHWRKPRQPRQ